MIVIVITLPPESTDRFTGVSIDDSCLPKWVPFVFTYDGGGLVFYYDGRRIP